MDFVDLRNRRFSGFPFLVLKSPFYILLAVVASPAYASGGTQVPEPSNLALFGLGLTGLIVGRLMAKRRKNTPPD